MKKTRVLIIDDSATLRRLIRARLDADCRIEVVGEAADPYEAREKIKALSPDVVTLDVEMPRMNGLEFLARLMRLRPLPVVMISTETHRGSAAAIEALSLGAVECLGKPAPDRPGKFLEDIADVLIGAAGARLHSMVRRPPHVVCPGDFEWNGRIVLIGASTGGVEALETVLGGFPENCPPTLITQHMPPGFLASFARRLDQHIAPRVRLASDGAPLLPGKVYLASGGETHLVVAPGYPPCCRLAGGDKRSGHRPSVDVLFESALPLAMRTVAVVLTGMGRDGAEGMATLRRAGARCIAQDESTSVIFGMPRAALELGGAEMAVPLPSITQEILRLTGADRTRCAGMGSQ
ncbi:chemotaxis response regulator protein-glutamate methylesterase [Ostreiculturibacter nitratireducens]|uniref:protein-glutamate methylesterase/protein-glutamine glutaminase n=1 Tax=Ostreiculturibacter nitratireducens TaxID=3075226 RepID=UPI0031B5AD3C